jgi:hypothetical protein
MTLRFGPIEEAEEHEAKRCPPGWSIIADHCIAAPRMLVNGLLPCEGLSFIGGQSGSGKTFIAVDLSVALASQTPFFGREVKERVGVAFFAAEGAGQVGNRLCAAADARGVKINDLPIAWRGDVPLLRNASDVSLVVVQLQQMDTFLRARYGVRLGVAILDTVAASFDLEDEDNNSEVARAIRHLRRIGAAFGGLMIPVHHYGKTAATGLRGGSAWRAGADVVMSVIAERKELTGEVTGRELAVAKARDGIEGPIAPFALTFVPFGTGEDGDTFGTCVVVPSKDDKPTKKAMKLSPVPRAGLRYLLECVADVGRAPASTSSHIPPGVKGVTLTEWRDRLEKVRVINPDGNPREQFKRIHVTLLNAGAIGIWEEFAWAVT